MPRSFLLVARDKETQDNALLAQCHVNLWFFNRRAITVEFGFILEVGRAFFDKAQTL